MSLIVNGTVTIDGITYYKAFENTFGHFWYVVKGNKCSDEIVATGIKAKNAKEALQKWLVTKDSD